MNLDHRRMAEGVIEEFLGHRLEAAGHAPGLREATIDLAATALARADVEQLMREQLDQLRHLSSKAIPDAYLADEAVAENALQYAAAGIRSAVARNGEILDSHFERGAAIRLGDDPRLAIRTELARISRPNTRPEALAWSLEPVPWAGERDNGGLWPPVGLEATASLRWLPGGSAALARVAGGPHADWVQIGLAERHQTPARRSPATPRRMNFVALGMEVIDDDPPDRSVPFTSVPWQLWFMPWQHLNLTPQEATSQLRTVSSPVVAFASDEGGELWLRRTGLGGAPFLLAPVLPLIVTLNLTPTSGICGFSLSDQDGPGLVSRHWRGHLVHDGNYQPLEPAVEGADLILRPDLFEQFVDTAGGKNRIRAGVLAFHKTGDEGETGDSS